MFRCLSPLLKQKSDCYEVGTKEFAVEVGRLVEFVTIQKGLEESRDKVSLESETWEY